MRRLGSKPENVYRTERRDFQERRERKVLDLDPETPALSVFSVAPALSVVNSPRIVRFSNRSAF